MPAMSVYPQVQEYLSAKLKSYDEGRVQKVCEGMDFFLADTRNKHMYAEFKSDIIVDELILRMYLEGGTSISNDGESMPAFLALLDNCDRFTMRQLEYALPVGSVQKKQFVLRKSKTEVLEVVVVIKVGNRVETGEEV